MIREAIDRIFDISRDSLAPNVFNLPDITDKVFLQQGGTVVAYERQPRARRHEVYRLEDLAEWAGDDTVSWVSQTQVVTVLDNTGLRESEVRLPLTQHSQLNAVIDLGKAGFLEHRDFVMFLRKNLRDPVETAVPGWMGIVRNLKVRQTTDTDSNVGHGNDSFGNAIAAEAIGIKELPEVIVLELPVWVGFGVRAMVHCEFIVDPLAGKFSLVPQAGEYERVVQNSLDWLTDQVAENVSGLVCQGTP